MVFLWFSPLSPIKFPSNPIKPRIFLWFSYGSISRLNPGWLMLVLVTEQRLGVFDERLQFWLHVLKGSRAGADWAHVWASERSVCDIEWDRYMHVYMYACMDGWMDGWHPLDMGNCDSPLHQRSRDQRDETQPSSKLWQVLSSELITWLIPEILPKMMQWTADGNSLNSIFISNYICILYLYIDIHL